MFIVSALIFMALAVLVGQTAVVGAIGAPTDNRTMPDIPAGDQPHDEIRPPVNYTLQGPTSQSRSTPPNFIPYFIGPSEGDKFRVTANESWYLDLDINTPGWLYIYEYLPDGEGIKGKWIAYKWQLPQSGLWRLGPFTTGNNQPEGQHIYRIWLYSDGQWAKEDPVAPQNNLVYWTYSKGQSTEQISPQPPIAPVRKATFFDQAYRFINKPMVILLGSSVLSVIVFLSLYVSNTYTKWRKGQGTVSRPTEVKPAWTSAAAQPAAASAKIALPNGIEIQLVGNSMIIGRGNLARALDLDELGLISRRHFELKHLEEQFYIEDLGSANGTRLNGADISGKGSVTISDDDLIEPAGAIRLKFYVL